MGEYARIACEGKVKFGSFEQANKSLRHNEKKRHPYHCRACGKFHLGTMPVKKTDRRKEVAEAYE